MRPKELSDREIAAATLGTLDLIETHMRAIARQIACHNAAEIPEILRRIEANTRPKVCPHCNKSLDGAS
jgi:hypothetical protein